ncbi:hypothetical protein [Pseudoxanthomonas indica]|uniref:Uncharacterized protein n=1 Tax=Pseudoxanthomonas indica TaxID=428993 RepID=A0A1T5JTQ1_9GAMM|nr:hypothetical protein [Pseudoxanthomonas indica]GGD44329.1 hypothetical protein GCM10007235_15350 [Pseudoxanthomonas indica]SKC54763.1 hypothetical protein SAMN06296058_1075 [Pseudoxanthomonas indica]
MKFIRSLIVAAVLSTTLITPSFAAEPADAQPAPEWMVGTYKGYNRNYSKTISKQDRAAVDSAVAQANVKAAPEEIDAALKSMETMPIKLTISADGQVTAKMASTITKGHYIGNNQIGWVGGWKSNIIRTDKGMNFSEVGNEANVSEYTRDK